MARMRDRQLHHLSASQADSGRTSLPTCVDIPTTGGVVCGYVVNASSVILSLPAKGGGVAICNDYKALP